MAYKRISPQPVNEGGTGALTLADHSVLIGSGTSAVSEVGPVASTGCVLQSNGVGSDPGFSTATYPSIATGTGTVLRADGSNWVATTATYPATTTINQVLYSSANNTISEITAANNGTMISGATGIPSWLAAGTTGQVLTATTGSPPSWASPSAGDVTSSANLTDNAVVRGDGGAKGVQTSTVLISDAGEMTNPSQPAFLAYQASSQTNATGAGTQYTLGTTTDLTEIFDQNGDFDHTTGVFTAPVTGRYNLTSSILIQSLTAAMTYGDIRINTSNRIFAGSNVNIGASRTVASTADTYGLLFTAICDMDAADTSTASVLVAGGAGNTAAVRGDSAAVTFFCGFLAC